MLFRNYLLTAFRSFIVEGSLCSSEHNKNKLTFIILKMVHAN